MTFGIRNEWRFLLKQHCCTTFTIWIFQVELDRMTGSVAIEFMLLGIGFYFCVAVREPAPIFIEALNEIVALAPVSDSDEGKEE